MSYVRHVSYTSYVMFIILREWQTFTDNAFHIEFLEFAIWTMAKHKKVRLEISCAMCNLYLIGRTCCWKLSRILRQKTLCRFLCEFFLLLYEHYTFLKFVLFTLSTRNKMIRRLWPKVWESRAAVQHWPSLNWECPTRAIWHFMQFWSLVKGQKVLIFSCFHKIRKCKALFIL